MFFLRRRAHHHRRHHHDPPAAALAADESVGCCRICGEECPVSDLIRPCGCKGTSALVHFACVQRWIEVPKKRSSAACEVCGEKWRGDFHIPDPLPAEEDEHHTERDEDESRARVISLLMQAHTRLASGTPRPMDSHTVMILGGMLASETDVGHGLWMDELTNLYSVPNNKSRSVYGRIKRGVRRLLGMPARTSGAQQV